MSAHLALRSGNPALTADTFTRVPPLVGHDSMTIAGTVNKTAMSLAVLLVANLGAVIVRHKYDRRNQ